MLVHVWHNGQPVVRTLPLAISPAEEQNMHFCWGDSVAPLNKQTSVSPPSPFWQPLCVLFLDCKPQKV